MKNTAIHRFWNFDILEIFTRLFVAIQMRVSQTRECRVILAVAIDHLSKSPLSSLSRVCYPLESRLVQPLLGIKTICHYTHSWSETHGYACLILELNTKANHGCWGTPHAIGTSSTHSDCHNTEMLLFWLMVINYSKELHGRFYKTLTDLLASVNWLRFEDLFGETEVFAYARTTTKTKLPWRTTTGNISWRTAAVPGSHSAILCPVMAILLTTSTWTSIIL